LLGVRPRGCSLDELWYRFCGSYRSPLIFILDEVDLLSEKDRHKDLLYLLARSPHNYMAVLLSNHPKFLNRLDETIVFHPLSREQIGKIVYILLRDIEKRLGEENLAIRLTEEAVAFLVNIGYDTKFGARPLKRSIQRYIEDPLSEKILMAEFAPGDEIEVLLAEDEESLRFQAASQASAT
jgi:ATP-dependent Clp protease ATP-binding subunit ClpA